MLKMLISMFVTQNKLGVIPDAPTNETTEQKEAREKRENAIREEMLVEGETGSRNADRQARQHALRACQPCRRCGARPSERKRRGEREDHPQGSGRVRCCRRHCGQAVQPLSALPVPTATRRASSSPGPTRVETKVAVTTTTARA
jgi:hypothetical protein